MALACEDIVASLADDPSLGRFVGQRSLALVWSAGGERLLWSSSGAGVSEPESGARVRLRELGGGLAPRLGFRLERLRLRASDGPDVRYACRRISLAGGDALLTILAGPDAASGPETATDATGDSTSAPAGPAGPEAGRPRSAAPVKTRFTWAADRDGRLTAVSPELAAAVGAFAAAIVGRRWGDLDGEPIAAGADGVAAALAKGEAWSGLVVLWKAAHGRFAIPVELAGAPVREGTGEPGFRGFGLCWIERRAELPEDEVDPDRDPPRSAAPVVDRPDSVARPGQARIDVETPTPDALAVEEPVERSDLPSVESSAPVGGTPPPEAGQGTAQETGSDSAAGADIPPGSWTDQSPGAGDLRAIDPVPPSAEHLLSASERGALNEIARALGARLAIDESSQDDEAAPVPVLADVREVEPNLRDQALVAALEIAADGVVWLDERGRILAMNPAAERLFRCDGVDARDQDLARLLHPDDHRVALACLERARAGGVATAEVRGRDGPAGPIPLELRTGRGAGEDAFVLAFRDVSRFKRAECRLEEARRIAESAKTGQIAFLARVSHEIRTPLNAIIGFAELMLGERFGSIGNERYRDYVSDIRESGGHVLSLVNDLLDLAKVTSGHAELAPTAVDLNAIISQSVATLGPLALRERTILRTSLAPHLPPVTADERSLRQVSLNVLSNAIRFSGSGGQAIVSTAVDGAGQVILRVRDTGPGMSADEVEAALTPFRQIPSTRREDGTGLGLPLSKALVEANGGVFAVTSRPGAGTLVEIRLPAARAAHGRARAAIAI